MEGISERVNITDWNEYLIKSREEFNKRFVSTQEAAQAKSNDFNFIRTLGQGAFGRVMMVQEKSSSLYYAAKLLNKQFIVEQKQVQLARNEKNILKSIRFPFTIHLEFFFQDNVYLYFIMPLVEGGEMFMHLRRNGKFNEEVSKFFSAQLLLALEYLHYSDLLYRDLKPENILIDAQGYIKLTDFGFCKKVVNRTYTLCGTPEYIAPEILLSRGYNKSVDYWAFGVLLYELNSGVTPFAAKDQMKIYEKIVEGKYKVPPYFSVELKDLIRHLLEIDISRRLGTLKSGIDDIKDHKWFKSIIWIAVVNKVSVPPYVPVLVGRADPRYFDKVEEVPLKIKSRDPYKEQFMDF